MKKILVLSMFFCGFSAFYAQNITAMTYLDDGKNMEGFGFINPVCSKDVLVKAWKDFIKDRGGKTKGGVISKVAGTGMIFAPSGKSWFGNFAYYFNDGQKDMTILTSFQDERGNFLTFENTPEEISYVGEALEKFKVKVQRSCYSDDLTNAQSYKESLQKEKSKNLDRIKFLQKNIQSDSTKVSVLEQNALTDKDMKRLQNMQAQISKNQQELQTLQQRNTGIDNELPFQEQVIDDFQEKLNSIGNK